MIFFEKYKRYFQWSIPVLAFLLYANTIPNDYNMDDELVTINHRNTSRGLSAISDIFSQYYYEDEMGYKYEYRPIAHLSFALEHEFLGESPHISHLINCLLYALLCLLLYKLLLSFFPQNMALLAWIAIVLFVFHPIHTEVVASIKNRDELLAVIFALLSGMFFINSVKKDNILYGLLSIVFLVSGMYSKMTVLPFTLVFPLFSLMLFHDKINRVFILSATFVIVGFQLSLLNSQTDKLKFIVISLLLIIFLFFQIKYRLHAKIIDFIEKFISSNKSIILKIKQNKETEQIIKLPFSISDLTYSGISLVYIGLLIYIKFSSLSFVNYNLLFLIFLFLLFLITRLNGKQLIAFLLVNFAFFFIYGHEQSKTLFMFFLMILISFQRTNLKLAFAILLIAVFSSVSFDSEFVINPQILFPVLMFFIGYKNYEKISFSNILLTIAYLIMILDYLLVGIDLIIYTISCFLLLVGFLAFQIFKKQLQTSFLIFFYFVLIAYNIAYHFSERLPQMSELTIELQESKKQESIPTNFSRPLHFIETPVNVHEPMHMKLATGMYVFGKYLQKTIIPYPMGFYYGYAYIAPKTFNDVMPWVMLGVFIFLGLLTLYWIVNKQYVLAFGLIIYLAGTFQALGIYVPIPGAMGDRFLFIPSIGFCILLAYPFYKAIGTKWQRPALAILAIILVAYGFLTIQRNFQWKDRITLFEADIEYLDKSAQAHALLADAYMRKATSENVSEQEYLSLAEKAIYRYQKAIAIYPDFLNFHFFKGKIHESLGQFEPAIASYKKAISLEKDFSYEPYLSLGSMYFEMQNYQESAYYLEQTIVMGFKAEYIYNSIFLCYANMGLFEKALNTIDEGLKVYPNNYDMNLNKAKLLLNSGNIEQALIYFKIADRINPGNPEIKAILQEFDSL